MAAVLRGGTLAGPWTGGMKVAPAVGWPSILLSGKPLELTVSAFTNAMTCIGIVWFVYGLCNEGPERFRSTCKRL